MMRQGRIPIPRDAAPPRRFSLPLAAAALALSALAGVPASAQTVPSVPVPGAPASPFANPQSEAQLMLRIDQIEAQLRTLTGMVEQYEFRVRQLEDGLRRFQEDAEFRFRELGAKGSEPGRRTGSAAPPPPPPAPQPLAQPPQPLQQPPAPPFPQPLAGPGQPSTYGGIKPLAPPGTGFPAASAPLDISPPSLGGPGPGPLPLGGGNPAEVTLAVPNDPQTAYEVAYAFILQRDYEAAQSAFADFLARYPDDKLAANAQYWLGESHYALGRYREAADAFLTGYRRYQSSSKGPDSLLKLAMSLQALGQKEAACASYAEFGRKFPKASPAMKDRVRAEQKGAGC